MGVHPTAIVADNAEIGEDAEVGPYCVIGPDVVLGPGCRLHSHVVIDGDTHLGANCSVYPNAVLGTMPQDKKLKSEPLRSALRVGENNQIREFVTIHGGTEFGRGETTIGSNNMLLVGCHIGHDAVVGNHVIFTNGAMAAGHTEIMDHAVLGAMVGVHQFARVGDYAMIGAGAMLSKDAPPFALVQGDRARLIGINIIGLKRGGFEHEQIAAVKRAFRRLFWRDGTITDRIREVKNLEDNDEMVQRIIEFTEASDRGLVMPHDKHEFHEHGTHPDP